MKKNYPSAFYTQRKKEKKSGFWSKSNDSRKLSNLASFERQEAGIETSLTRLLIPAWSYSFK